jgi:hypothetical protein
VSLPAVRHGISRVGGEIEEDLVEVHRVQEDGCHCRCMGRGDGHRARQHADEERAHFIHGSVERQGARDTDLFARKGEQTLGERGGAIHRPDHVLYVWAERSWKGAIGKDQLALTAQYCQQIVEIVGHAAGHATEGVQFFCLLKLLGGMNLLGDVATG